jgi:multidrug efflux pump subunit AcrA (membrane-fusion protein)
MKSATFCLIGAMLINSIGSTPVRAQGGRGIRGISDEEPATETRIQIFVLKHAPAVETEQIVRSLFSPNRATTVTDGVGNRLIIRGDEQTIKQIGELLKELDQPSENAAIRSTLAFPLDRPAIPNSRFGLHGVGSPDLEFQRIEAIGGPAEVGVRQIVAAGDGEVAKILIRDGDEVKEGAVLVEMGNPDLELSIRHLEAKRHVAGKELELVKKANERAPGSIAKIELEKLEAALNVAETELALAQLQKQKLTIVSPIAGKVIAPNLHDRLIKRYMRKGDVLFGLALSGQPFTVALPEGNATWAAAAPGMPPVVDLRTLRANAQARHGSLLDQRRRALWAGQYTELAASDSPDRDQKLTELKKDIRKELVKSLDEKQTQQSQRIEALEQRLTALKKSVEEQKKNRDGSIEEQLNEIIGEGKR